MILPRSPSRSAGSRRELAALKREIYAHLEPWQIVQVSRHQQRPQTRDYIDLIFEQFLELHGDRALGDDKAIVTGLAHLDDIRSCSSATRKARTLPSANNATSAALIPRAIARPLAKMRLAEKFGLPIISFIDTPGAYPGITAEERGQASVIAENLMAMSQIRTPIVGVVIGEGGSGGALGIGIGDRLAMLEFTYYSVISPEGCASILWKGSEHAPKAAAALKLHQPRPSALRNHRRDHRRAARRCPSRPPRGRREPQDIPHPFHPPAQGNPHRRARHPPLR